MRIRDLDIWAVGSQSVKAPDGGCKLVAFLALEKQLRDLLASALVVGCGRRFLFLFLVLIVNGAEAIFRVNLLMLRLCVLGFYLPNAFLLQRKRSPAVPCQASEKYELNLRNNEYNCVSPTNDLR
jgi:hypothetical protein